VFPARDGRTVYLTSVDSMYRFDLVAKEVLARTSLPGLSGGITISPDGRTIYATDGGDSFNSPGSGKIAVFDADLNPQPPIDLGTSAAVNGQPPSMQGAAVSSDGRMLYVAAGTPSRGPLYGPQPARLLVVDCSTRRLLRAIPLNDWAPAGVYVY
jgi:DNA-binding beta-propeller fold protein YncE